MSNPLYDFSQINQQTQPGSMYGYQYPAYPAQPQQAPVAIFNQLLTADEVARLQKRPSAFSTRLTEDEFLRAVCTHKDMNNHVLLEQLSNGKHRCPICQAEFFVVDVNTSKEEIDQICGNMYDLLQTIKTYYGNAPAVMKDFYMMVGFMLKIPNLWEMAKTYFNKAVGNDFKQSTSPDQSIFSTLGTIMGPAALTGVVPGAGGYYSNPVYYQPPTVQAMAPQVPMQQPAMAPVPPGYAMVPQPAILQAPSQPVQQQPANPDLAANPTYGYSAAQYAAPAPAPVASNPIGFVEPTQPQDFTASRTQQSVPPLPPNPTNPNIQPNKATVGKTFNG